MSEDKPIKLFTAAKELNIGTGTIVDFLATKGYKILKHPTTQLDAAMYSALLKEFAFDKSIKEEAKQISIGKIRKEEVGNLPEKPVEHRRSRDFENEEILIKNVNQYSTPPADKPKPAPAPPATPAPAPAAEKVEERTEQLPGVKIVGKIDLEGRNVKHEPVVKKEEPAPVAAPKVVEPEPIAEVKAPVAPPVKEEVKPEPVVAEAPKPEPVKATEPPVATAAPVAAEQPQANDGEPAEEEVIRARAERLTGPNVIGKIQLPVTPKRNPVASSSNTNSADHKRKRKRKDGPNPQGGNNQQGGTPPPQGNINPNRPDFRNNRPGNQGGQGGNNNRPDFRNNRHTPANTGPKEEPSEKDIQDQIKATLARLSGAGKSGKFAQRAKFRRQNRDDVAASAEELAMEQELQS